MCRETCLLFALLLAALPAGAAPQYRSYDYAERSENALKEVRLTIPEGLAVVRGLLVVSNPAGGDTRGAYTEPWYNEFLTLHGFAFVGARGFNSHTPSRQAFENALKQFAGESGHPELVNVPYVTTGFSAGGGFASRLLVEVPERVIAAAIICSRINFTGVTPSAANMATPACIISGEKENLARVVEPVLAECRPKGALFGWMTVQGAGHQRCGQEVLAMPLLDAAVRLRYPADADVRKGPVKLKALDPKDGWVADNTTWKAGLTRIAPAGQFRGDAGKSSWLPTEDLAFIYRAYATYDPPIAITSPAGRGPVLDAGAGVTITVDDTGFPGWKKLELYDGARKVAEIAGRPARFQVEKLAPGYHAFSVLGTDAKGDVRTSRPVLVMVRQPAGG